jgi:hypothetical protein
LLKKNKYSLSLEVYTKPIYCECWYHKSFAYGFGPSFYKVVLLYQLGWESWDWLNNADRIMKGNTCSSIQWLYKAKFLHLKHFSIEIPLTKKGMQNFHLNLSGKLHFITLFFIIFIIISLNLKNCRFKVTIFQKFVMLNGWCNAKFWPDGWRCIVLLKDGDLNNTF